MYLITLIENACMNCIIGRLFYNPRFLGGCPAIMDGLNLPSQNVPGSTIGNLRAVLLLPLNAVFVFTRQPPDLRDSGMKAIII